MIGLSRSHDLGVDLLDEAATRDAVRDARPDVVYHLAARAQVGESWRAPGPTMRENLAMTFNLLEAVRAEAPGATVVAVSSGEVYGRPEVLPVDETAPLRPQNPYAVSKAAADLLAGVLRRRARRARDLRARAFNHAGPRQEPIYAIASFARQVAAGLEAGDDPVRVVTGNPDTRRDFTDVRDVVRAYRLLAGREQRGVYQRLLGSHRVRARVAPRARPRRRGRDRSRGRRLAAARPRGHGGARRLPSAARGDRLDAGHRA